MSTAQRLKRRFRRFLQRPGATIVLTPLEKFLPQIEAREEELEELSDDELTELAKEAVSTIEICALGREAARRALDERPYDVQLLGVMSLLGGTVVEMATGEGKTLTAAIASYGFIARGDGPVHILTVNDYLARRDAEWMEPVYRLLGLSVGWVTEASTREERQEAYSKDITYVSVSEAGFDYLRDQLVTDIADRVQPELATAIVDEADSILIDEARVPMVLAGAVPGEQDPVHTAASLVRSLRPMRDYEIDEDRRNVILTTQGLKNVERKLGLNLYAEENVAQLSAINVALHAHVLLHRDVDYIVRNGAVELVDEMRGRVAQRRRWPDGLQAAVEAKEGLDATAEGEVLGTITVQAFIQMYRLVCGMTATAVHVGEPLREFFKLEVAVIPPNAECIRVDEPDRIYASHAERDEMLLAEIKEQHEKGRPILIGTLDVKESEDLAKRLEAIDVPCVVLNAKNDAEEAAIIAEAGKYGAVTVSTQMAGRGVDIRLGGSDQSDRERVAELDGLLVIGCGRHDSRRVDDQLRGRAGRQGDPGRSVFFVSLEDELIMRNAADAIPASPKMTFEGLVTDEQVDWAVEHAQRIAEGVNAEIHRNTWRYNVVIEQQRKVLAERRERLLTTDIAADLLREKYPDRFAPKSEDEPADTDDVSDVDETTEVDGASDADETAEVDSASKVDEVTGVSESADADEAADKPAKVAVSADAVDDEAAADETADTEASEPAGDADDEASESDDEASESEDEDSEDDEDEDSEDEDDDAPKFVDISDEKLSQIARSVALYHLDRLWAEHLATLSEIREGVHLRALGRLDPLDEFHRSAVPAFNQLMPEIEKRFLETVEEMDFTEDWEPDRSKLVRPSATWTYLVHDNPFGSELDRLVASVGRKLGRRR